MRISDWSSDVCSSDLGADGRGARRLRRQARRPACGGKCRGVRGALVPRLAPLPARRAIVRRQGQSLRRAARALPLSGERNAARGRAGLADRKRVGEGKSVSVRVYLGGRGINKKKKQ